MGLSHRAGFHLTTAKQIQVTPDMSTSPSPVPCRLLVILAREAPVAVIFRRGPSKLVELIKWHTDIDTFERGQWFKGRIYEDCSDLSPDGSLLIYFAAKLQLGSRFDEDHFPPGQRSAGPHG